MKNSKALITAVALLTLPSLAFAQIPTGALTDAVKDKAVETVLDNATPDDAFTVGKTLLKGGSKEDAALAVVKGRAEDKVEGFTGTNVDLDDLSKDGMIDAGKDALADKAAGSASKYTNGVPSLGGVSSGSVQDAAKGVAIEKAKNSATSYGVPVIPKSGGTNPQPTTTTTTPVNCPSGTKDAGDGTCMITGNWNF